MRTEGSAPVTRASKRSASSSEYIPLPEPTSTISGRAERSIQREKMPVQSSMRDAFSSRPAE